MNEQRLESEAEAMAIITLERFKGICVENKLTERELSILMMVFFAIIAERKKPTKGVQQ